MSPDDWRVAYLVDKSDTVWRTSDAGVTWTDISGVPGDGSIHDVARSLQTITVVPIEGEDFVFVGGLDRSCDPPVEPLTIGPVVGVSPKNQSCGGGVFVSSSTAPLWSNYGIGLPNALVTTLGYDKKDDVLFAGTYGRGAWTIPHLSTLFPPPGPLRPVLGKPACTTSAHGPIITPATPITLRSPEAVTSISYATYPDGSTPVFGSLPPDAATFTISGPPDTYNVEYFANNGGNEGVHGQFSVRLVVDEAFLVRECALEQRQMQLHAYIEKVFHDYPVLRSPVRLVERAQKRVVRAISDAASGNIARSDARIQSALRSHQHLQSRLESPKYQVIDASTRSTLSGMNLDIVYQLDSAVVGQCRACQGTPAPRCGDGVCSAGDETCATCPLDCGECQSCACDQKTRDECQGCAVGCGCCNMCDCGDGVCGNEEDCTVCPADCGPCQLHVFATSAAFSGAEIGGLAGADALCRDEAGAAGLEGAYKAWLSDSGTSAADRISHGTVPYVLVDGTKIADDWDDLTDGSIDAPIVLSASGTDVGFGGAWTATGPSGALSYPANTCANWTSNSGLGADGYRGATSADWTRNSVQPLDYCSVRSVLYCFEQSDSDSAETTTSTSTTSTTTTTTSTMMPCGGTPGACHGACPPGLVCLNNAVCQCGTP